MFRDCPAPQFGFYATTLRALMDALLLYLPLALMGRQPTTPSALTFLATEDYYWASVFLMPIFLIALWLLLCNVLHLILKMSGKKSDIDVIMNITGLVDLVVGAVILIWDWVWIFSGWNNPVLLGISHLIIDIWAMYIIILGFRKLLDLSLKLSIILCLVWMLLGIPLSMLFVRPPV
jgi:uncharacterized membrane protein HdeD (DUF308 family)